MTKKVFVRGILTTGVVAVILFWVVGMMANNDPLWFMRSFHPDPARLDLYWDETRYTLEPGDAGFDALASAFVDGVAHYSGYEGLVVFSEANWTNYREHGRLLEVYYDTPVQVHSRHSFSKAPTYLVALNRTHSYYRRVFGLPENAEWAVGAISMDARRFELLLAAAESAVSLTLGEIPVDMIEESVGTSDKTPEQESLDTAPTPIAISTPVPLDSETDTSELLGLAFNEFLEQSYYSLLVRNPEYVTEMGLVDELGTGNDKLTDISDAYVRETYLLQREIYATLMEYDRSALSPAEQRSFDIYRWYLEDLIQAQDFMYNDYLLSQLIISVHNNTVYFFTDIHPITSYQDAEDYIIRLSQINTKFTAALEGLKIREELGVILPKFLIQWTLGDLRAMAQAEADNTPYVQTFNKKLSQLENVSELDKKALSAAAVKMVADAVLPAYEMLADYYTELLKVATDDAGVWKFPNGKDYYAYQVKHFTTTELTPDEIHQIGLEEVDRIDAEMRAIFQTLGYPEDGMMPNLFQRAVQESGILQGKDILYGYETLIQQANERLKDSFDLLPSSDVVVIENPVGGYYVAPAKDGSRPGAFYANASGSNPKLGMPTLAYHEAVPGHHFQIAIAQELDIPSFRQDSYFTAYTEGWALYAEYLAWELGFYEDDPYGNLGRLQAEMFRAVRLVVDTGIHDKGWSFQQAVDYMVQHTGKDRRNVEYEIARYIAWPGQSLAYKIGMLKIMVLRQKAEQALGDDFDLRTFHNSILGEGSVPLSLLEPIVDEYIAAELAD